MDPDSPLNRAHQIERQAEKRLQSCRYDQASSCYIRAADQLEVAIQQTQNPSAILSLRLQLENLRKQPLIIKKRQQWSKQDSAPTHWNGPFLKDDTPDGLRDQEPTSEVPAGGVAEPDDGIKRIRTDSSESRFSSFEEADSLLAMIRQHRVIEDEQPRYHLSQLLVALRTLGSDNGHRDIAEPLVSGEPAKNETPAERTCKLPKTQKTIVQELLTQNQELQSHLMQLFHVLESCEQENQKLQETVSDLRQELEECRMRCVTREVDHYGMGTNSRLEAPFSLIEGFACTPPSESLPPLSPLHIPDFGEVDEMI